MSAAEHEGMAEVEGALGLAFRNRDLLQQAFVHRSFIHERNTFPVSNERLEFLGDAVIGFVAAAMLYQKLPNANEGELTTLRAALVRTETLARIATGLQLGRHLCLGRGEEASGGRRRQRLLAATFEALVGAIELDLGIDAARLLVERVLDPELGLAMAEQTRKDAKSRLQERTQAELQITPAYRVVAAEGPDHAKVFSVVVQAGDRVMGTGKGRTKQEAEQAAAASALSAWDET